MKRIQLRALLATCLIVSACSESSFDPEDPATITPSGSLPVTPAAGSTITPAVLVRDAGGRPLPGVVVTFQVTAGGGSLGRAASSTNGDGIASVPWTLGPEPGINTVVARVGDLAPISLSVTSCGVYCIDIRYVGEVSAAHRAAFTNARTRWEDIITGDLPAIRLDIPAAACEDAEGNALVDHPAVNEAVDDLLVYVQVDSIDGPGQVLGSAGPCFIRGGSRLPVFGIMRFDRADLNQLQQNGLLGDVILHELAHVLGFPTVWSDAEFDLLVGKGTDNPYFIGTSAVSAFQLAGGTPVNGEGVPVENSGGVGTRDSHWREAVMGNELMTGFVSAGSNPLSRITIASLQDIGYEVDLAAADAYTVPTAAGMWGWSTLRTELLETPLAPPRTVH